MLLHGKNEESMLVLKSRPTEDECWYYIVSNTDIYWRARYVRVPLLSEKSADKLARKLYEFRHLSQDGVFEQLLLDDNLRRGINYRGGLDWLKSARGLGVSEQFLDYLHDAYKEAAYAIIKESMPQLPGVRKGHK